MKLTTLLNNALTQSKQIPLTKLRRKAAKLGLSIEIDRIGRDIGYWIDGGNDSVFEGERYCSSKEELDDKLSQF